MTLTDIRNKLILWVGRKTHLLLSAEELEIRRLQRERVKQYAERRTREIEQRVASLEVVYQALTRELDQEGGDSGD
jgi:hypothetical protein